MRISKNHPIRKVGFVERATSLVDALQQIDEVLSQHDLCLGCCPTSNNDSGRVLVPLEVKEPPLVCPHCHKPSPIDNCLCISWHWLGQNDYEIVAYISI